MRVAKYVLLIILFFIIANMTFAQVPPPPADIPGFGSGDADDKELNSFMNSFLDELGDNDNLTPDIPEDSFNDLPDEPEPIVEPEDEEETLVDNESSKEPQIECPASDNSNLLTYILSFILVALISALIVMTLKLRKKDDEIVLDNPIDDINTENDSIIEIQDEITKTLTEYINSCRSQGFSDDDIKLELLKNGYSAETIKQLF